MLGTLKSKSKSVAVVGGGISGLLAAYRISKDDSCCVDLFESEKQVGGIITSVQTNYGLTESAAHSILGSSKVRHLAREIGVNLIKANSDSQARYIYRNGKMKRMPLTLMEAFGFGIRVLAMPRIPGKTFGEGLKLSEWAEKYFGKAATRHLIAPMLAGIYAARPEDLCISATHPGAVKNPKSFFKRPRGKLSAPEYGMYEWALQLEQELRKRKNVTFHLGKAIPNVAELRGEYDNAVLCVPAHIAAALIQAESSECARALSMIRYAPLVSTTLFYPKSAFKKNPKGIGVLFPDSENRNSMGILFNSSAFAKRAEADTVSLTVIMGGTIKPEMVNLIESEILQKAVSEIREVLGALEEPLHSVIHRWEKALPVYDSNVLEAWGIAKSTWAKQPGSVLFANYTGQISIRGLIETSLNL